MKFWRMTFGSEILIFQYYWGNNSNLEFFIFKILRSNHNFTVCSFKTLKKISVVKLTDFAVSPPVTWLSITISLIMTACMIPPLLRGNLRVKPHNLFTPRPQSERINRQSGPVSCSQGPPHGPGWSTAPLCKKKQKTIISIFTFFFYHDH